MTAPAKSRPALNALPLRSPRRITIASGKAGVGKTWTPGTLAQAFALMGERVLTAEPTSLTAAYAFIKVIRMHAPKADIRTVVNRAQGAAEGKRSHLALSTASQNFLGFAPPLMGVIPDDSKVADAIRHQTALFLRHPQSKAGAAVQALAKEPPPEPG